MNLQSLLWILSAVSQSWAIECYHCESTGEDKSCEEKSPSSKWSRSCGNVPSNQSESDTKKFDRFVCGTWKYTVEESNIDDYNANANAIAENRMTAESTSSSSSKAGFKRQCFGIKIEKNSIGGRLHAYKVLGTINYGKFSRPGSKFTITDPKKKKVLIYDNNMYRLCDDKDNCNTWVSSAPRYKIYSMTMASIFFFLLSSTGFDF